MKFKLRNIIFLFMLAVTSLFVPAGHGGEADSAGAVADSTAAGTSAAAAVDTVSPQSRWPVLKINGKDEDVYLQSLDIQVEVTGNIASTRYTMVFKNKTGRVLEGTLTFPLPDGRSVTHYALDIDGKMREAVPVEKAKGTQVFEEIQRRRVDPGLLERVEGNNFRTRIYPFPANGTRTISIGYEEELPLENGSLYYRLPTAYPSPLEKFSVKAAVWQSDQKPIVPESGAEDEIRFDKAGESYVASFAKENYRPARALIFALPAPADIPQVIMQSAQGSYYFLASVAPKIETRKKQWGDELAIIWDVSLSGSQRDLKRELEMLDIIFAEKKNVDVHLYFLNNRFKRILSKNTANGEYKIADGKWDELKNALEKAIFDGGTNFSENKLDGIKGDEILFFSDGISTLGDADFVKDAKTSRPIHSVVSSSKADYSTMRLIAGKTRGKFVNLNALSPEKLKDELLNETLQFLGTSHDIKHVREVYPSIATPVSGNFSIAGIADTNDAELTLLFGFGNEVETRIKVRLDAKNAADRGNVYKIWAQKKIAELDLDYEKNRGELTDLGKQFGIVTRNTSLIVLETVGDYIRFDIEPPAELQAEYQRELKARGERRRISERDMLDETAAAAEKLNKWRNRDFKSKKPKHPEPDNKTEASSTEMSSASRSDRRSDDAASGGSRRPDRPDRSGGSGYGFFSFNKRLGDPVQPKRGSVGIYANETREPYEEAIVQARSGDILTIIEIRKNHYKVRTAYGLEGWARKSELVKARARDYMRNRAFAFESAEVIGYLDNPAPLYIIDMDDPSGDPISLNFPGRHGGGAREDAAPIVLSAPPSRSPLMNALRREPTIAIKPVKKDNEYLKKLTGKTADDYRIYLRIRGDYAGSPTFYFDMAEWFYARGDKETALRILTSIADLELENASLYRLLGYRFKEYGEHALAKFVCKKVIEWRPMEPQSYRDYALALADNGEPQAALDSLYSVLSRPYPRDILERARGIEEVAVTEINRLIAKNPRLNTSKIDKRLLIDIPVDVRVVINWNMDNTDIDLHVKDPRGEECHYGRRETKIGGRISADNTSGYGPEQFMLKNAAPGKYQIYVNYFSDAQFTDAGPSTVMAEIYTKYAGEAEQRKVVCLQMSNAKRRDGRKVMVAEFTF
jgi:tetratricopeptide (TPR) repeat protein